MLAIRVIPTLLLKNSGLVKGVNFKNHKYVGDPINAVKIFNEKEVDELVFLDVSATNENREPDYRLIEDIASEAFIPFGYGGGITNIKQVKKIIRLGVEKVIINTSAINDLTLITDAAKFAGSQSVVVSIDTKKNFLGKYRVATNSGLTLTKLDPIELAVACEKAGAGEVMLTSIDNEGTSKGYDLDLINKICTSITIPVVASGGAGSLEHFKQAIDSGASAVAAGSYFIFHGRHKAVLITYPEYEQLEQLFKE